MLLYSQNDGVWQLLWELYGFQREQKLEYGEEVKRLREVLNSARKRWERRVRSEKIRQAEIKQEKLENRVRWVLRILAAAGLFLFSCCLITADQRYIVKAMSKKYAMVEFTKPKWTEFVKGYYHFTSSVHPDMEITAYITKWVHNGGRSIVIEDYGVQVLGCYAEQYGLKTGMAKTIYQWDLVYENSGILYYPAGSLGELAEFCGKSYQMFQEQEELQTLRSVGFCMEGALYEEMMLTGGKKMVTVSEPQFFNPWEMTEEELTQKVQEAYVEYMFNYEPWKLTLQEYKELGAEYEKLCSRMEGQGEWYELYVSGERVCGLHIKNLPHGDYSQGYEMSIGNVYYYLLQQGAQISVLEDGAGFDVLKEPVSEEETGSEREEEWIHFGEEPYLEVDKLKEQLPAFDWKEEGISNFAVYL